MSKVVKKTLSDCKLTAARKRELAKLAALPDHEINLSDIPELTDEFWRNAVRGRFYRPIKKQITLRLDADVIAWLRKHGKGYQTKANALLREMMVKEIEKAT